MFKARSIAALTAALFASLLPLQPSRAFAAQSCPDVTDVQLAPSPPVNHRGATGELPWVAGGTQLTALVDLNYNACPPGGVIGPPGLQVPVFLSSSNPSVASVPLQVFVPLGADGGTFVITTHGQLSPSPVTITAQLNTPAHLDFIVLAAAPAYTITDLGTLSAASGSWAHGINSHAAVVGVSGSEESTVGHAFTWTGTAGMQDLGTLPGHEFSTAAAINDAGTVVGTSVHSYLGHIFARRAVIWQGGSITDLGTVNSSDFGSSAKAINNLGQVVGGYETGSFFPRPFIWSASGGMHDLGVFSQYSGSVATSINDSDTVVGLAGSDPIVWTGGAPRSLGVTPAQIYTIMSGNFGTIPEPQINNAGTVVFGNLVSAGGTWTAMASLPDSFSSVMPIGHGLNQAGQVVGTLPGENADSGFLYAAGNPKDLNWLTDQSSPWLISKAQAINDAGQIAAIGYSASSGGYHALLLSPVTQADTTPPVVSVPSAPIVAEATGPSGAAVTFSASATDPDNGVLPVSCSPASGSTFPLGSTTVTCSATDPAGNSGHASFSVVVRDTTPPVLTVTANMAVDATSPAGAAVSFSSSAVDLVDGIVPVTCVPTSGTTFAIGDTTVVCNAADRSGNSATASFKIHVRGASEQVTDLLNYVTQNNIGPGNSLAAKLNATLTSLAASDQASACSTLQSFINEVQAQAGKKITLDQAAQLLSAANQIRSVLGC